MSGYMKKVGKSILTAFSVFLLSAAVWAQPYPFAQYMNIKFCGRGDISPAGDKILFTSNMPGVAQLYVMSSEGG